MQSDGNASSTFGSKELNIYCTKYWFLYSTCFARRISRCHTWSM